MDGLSTYEVMLVQCTWSVAISLTTLGILWSARSLPVYLWFLSGLLGAGYALLVYGPIAETLYPMLWGQYLIGITVIGNIWLKAISIRLLLSNPRVVTYVKVGAALLIVIFLAPLLEFPRPWFSIFITLTVATLIASLARDAYILGRSVNLRNALVFAAALLPQSIFIILMSLSAVASGSDPLPPQEGNLPIGSTLLAIIISLVNSAVFIALILDLHIRQRDDMRRDLVTARVEQSRLAEREQILADMHDGLGSQLATAKLKAESGHLNQEQVVNLLRECMADLHLLVDSLRDQGDGLAAALADHRYRTERRLAGIDIQLAWQVELDDAPVLPPKTTIQVLRIVQEAINNALKHAHAHKIVIAANYSREHGFVIRVEDDGYGIPAEPTQQQGLRNMHRRARDIGATLTVRRGAEDKGTVVELANLESR